MPEPKNNAAEARQREASRIYRFQGEAMRAWKWADELGVSTGEFLRRVHVFGFDENGEWDTRIFCESTPPVTFTFGNEEFTAAEWAAELGISERLFLLRYIRHGLTEKTFRIDHTDCPRQGSVADQVVSRTLASKRIEFIRSFVRQNPDVREDGRRGFALVQALIEHLGPMSQVEVGEVFGVTRSRIEQIERVAQKRLRLAGGAVLREHWEHSIEDRKRNNWEAVG